MTSERNEEGTSGRVWVSVRRDNLSFSFITSLYWQLAREREREREREMHNYDCKCVQN